MKADTSWQDQAAKVESKNRAVRVGGGDLGLFQREFQSSLVKVVLIRGAGNPWFLTA